MSKRSRSTSSNRRTFLKTISLAGVSGLLLPKYLRAKAQANSRVIVVEDAAATTGNSINTSVVQTMVDSGIKSLAQNDDVGEAWKTLLPGVSASSVIALKVNCLFTLCTHPIVTLAVADSLSRMMFSGSPFPENSIIIYDMSGLDSNGGYTINTGSTGIRCMHTGWTGSYDVAGVNEQLSSILVNEADFLINIAVLKNHSMSGVSLCLKNNYGTCENPGGLHGGNYCDPYIPALNALAPIKTKQKVCIIDALFGIVSGGPGGPPEITVNKLIMSTDIVAIDCVGRDLLEEKGCRNTDDAYHIDSAATMYALGTNDPSKIDIVNIMNPSTGMGNQNELIPRDTALHQNYPNPFNPSTNVKYEIAQSGHASLKVYDISGREVATLADGFHRAGTYTARFAGNKLSSGTYICHLQTARAVYTVKMVLIK
jgi:uncharacterized protein (DUF362 family)